MSLHINIQVDFRSADAGQDDIVWSVVKDKLLELRGALLLLSMTQQTFMNPPTIGIYKRGDGLAERVDLEQEKHSDEL